MTTLVVAIVVGTVLFIAVDLIRSKVSSNHAKKASLEVVSRETERLVQLDVEVDGKLEELRRRGAEPTPRESPLPDEMPASMIEASPSGRDPMNDTRCMQAVREKADEFEREVRKRAGLKPS